ncbi:hypothetical protein F5Y19DRAFT_464980 [Xylariaceae sp. FL1651]|nr:hypothetical protein F5Y19DRAFT_464980 [Xylariaceae sp. FL1651]
MPPMWLCNWVGCQSPAVQRAGDCLLCDRHLCKTHLQDQWHTCPKPETNWNEYSAWYAATESRRLEELCRRIDGRKLCALARFRLSSPISPPPEVRDYVLRSEAATLEFLQRHTPCESDPANTVGVAYILMEKLHGTPLDWQGTTAAQKEKVVRQLVDIMLEIERHPFDKLGSLVAATAMSGGEAAPGLARLSTFRSGEGDRLLGHSAQAYLQMIASGEFGTAENAVDVFLTHRFRLEVLDRVWKTTSTVDENEKFFLKHADDKGDHIFVNADFDIVGVIDWEWCSAVSKEEAFSSPCMLWPVAAFYDGSNELADEELLLARVFCERGREDLARCVLDGRKVQRLLFALGPSGASNNRKTVASLFMGLKQAFDPGHGGKDEKPAREEEGWEVWRARALVRWEHEDLLQAVLKSK